MAPSHEALQWALEFSRWMQLALCMGWLLLFVASVLGAWRWRKPGWVLVAVGFGFLTLRVVASVVLWLLESELPQDLLMQWTLWSMYLSLADALFALLAAIGLLWLALGGVPNQASSRSR